MKKVLIGAAVGLVAGVVLYKLYKEYEHEDLGDQLNKLTGKAKKGLKDLVDAGKNQAEYVQDRARYKLEESKKKNIGFYFS